MERYYIIKIGKSYWSQKKDSYIGNKQMATKYSLLSEVRDVVLKLREKEVYVNMGIEVIECTETKINI